MKVQLTFDWSCNVDEGRFLDENLGALDDDLDSCELV
jgi:hypothetical protein